MGSFDGTSNELGEVGDVEGKGQWVVRRLYVTAIHINGVGHRLEGVEGDSHGQDDFKGQRRDLPADTANEGRQTVSKKVEVFKEAEDSQVGGDAGEQKEAFPRNADTHNGLGTEKVDHCR